MYIRKIPAALIATLCLSLTGPALCEAAASGASAPQQPLYIADFKPELAQGNSSGGLLSHLGASRRAEKVDKNASALADALVRELNARGVATYRLSEQDPTPRSGWVVSGVFSENVPSGLPLSQLASLGSSTPNTQVELTIVDVGGDSARPASIINTAASLSGQGSAASFNPYAAAAKVVLHHVESGRSIDDLARKVADQILAQRV
jgi:hypothetical protein